MRYSPPTDAQMADLEADLGYQFADRSLLTEAFTHPSTRNGAGPNNYRLAWLGDAVLTAVAASELFQAMPPHTSKGVLHNQREQAKTTAACAGFARFLKLDGFLVVGGGYEGQDPSDRMLAEVFEAMLGAIWEDSGRNYDAVRGMYARVAGPNMH